MGGRGVRHSCGVGVRLFAGFSRRLHAPLALVGKPTRSVLCSRTLPQGFICSIGRVLGGSGELLLLIGRLVSFEGVRRKTVRLGLSGIGVISFVARQVSDFSRLLRGQKVVVQCAGSCCKDG